jgi:hypothetical protein
MPVDKVPFYPRNNTRIVEPNSDQQIVTVPLEHVDFGSRSTTTRQIGNVKNGMTIKHVESKG